MTLRLNGSTSGYSEIDAPAVAGDQTFTLPGTGGNLITDGSDLTTQVKTATNATGSAPIYSCRAWVNFNGTGTVAIRASGNVSSITDNGTGDYTVNFTTAMVDANYSAVVVCSLNAAGSGSPRSGNASNPRDQTASVVRIYQCDGTSGSLIDTAVNNVSIFR